MCPFFVPFPVLSVAALLGVDTVLDVEVLLDDVVEGESSEMTADEEVLLEDVTEGDLSGMTAGVPLLEDCEGGSGIFALAALSALLLSGCAFGAGLRYFSIEPNSFSLRFREIVSSCEVRSLTACGPREISSLY